MRKFLHVLALSTALCGLAYAADTDVPGDDEKALPTCYTEQAMSDQAKAASIELVVRLAGEELANFNAAYEKRFQRPAPENDVVLIFTVTGRPEAYWLLSFSQGCLMANPAMMAVEMFKELHEGQSL